jgi:diguanylate cyclase (GGDEF)-like protein/PAS domain S-box-containing protein
VTDRIRRWGFGALWRHRLVGRSVLAVLLLTPLFWLGRREGFVASESLWAIIGVLLLGLLATASVYTRLPGAQQGGRLVVRVAVHSAAVGAVIYAIGWGPTLAVGFLVVVAENLRLSGSRAMRPALMAVVGALGLGQLAIAIGLAPSFIEEPLVHGLALFVALGIIFIGLWLGWAEADKETAELVLRASEERFKALVQHASDIIMVIGLDGTVVYVSPAFQRLLGYLPGQALGRQARDFMHPDDVEEMQRSLGATPSPGRIVRANVRASHVLGSWHWFDARVTDLRHDESIGGLVANMRDVSDEMEAQSDLREAEERFRGAFEDAPIGMALADPEGRLFRVNRALAHLLGYEPEEMLGVRISEITHPDDWTQNVREMRRLFAGEISGYKLEKRYLHATGAIVWVSVSVSCVRDDDGAPRYMIGQVEDITERRAIAERLAHAAIHDTLTNLPNRLLLGDRLAFALDQARRRGTRVGVIFLDLDRFKMVNDSLGHAAGDDLLRVLGDRLATAIRPGDTVARFGGDEFAVLCDGVTDEAEVLDIAARLAAAVARPVRLTEREVFVTASVGVVLSRSADTAETLLRDVDAAMYRAKEAGRARIEVFDETSHSRAVAELEIDTDLHRALERREFRVHYQPIVELETGRVSGFEALVRWQHPARRLLLPREFIALADETGLIVPIGEWVLEAACRQTMQWQQHHESERPLTVSVNLAPRQLADPTFPEQLARILHATQIDPDTVWLELTEGALMNDAAASISALQTLREQGVHVAVDDFGTGYSSLGHLKRFPVESLKVDQTFVDGLGRDPDDTSIVAAVVNLAHSLGLAAVAEGLETEVQLAELRTMGCDFAQGYLFGAPKASDEIGDDPASDLRTWQPS